MKRGLLAVLWLSACSKAIDTPTPVDVTLPENLESPTAAVVDRPAVLRPAEPERIPPPLTLLPTVSYSPAGARSVAEVLAVTVRVELKGSQGAHEVIAHFEGPGGFAYERRVKPVDGSAFDVHTVEFVLPVAGTMIQEQGLTGMWTAAVYHDGDKLTAPTFELTP